jgi:hypothetical protein
MLLLYYTPSEAVRRRQSEGYMEGHFIARLALFTIVLGQYGYLSTERYTVLAKEIWVRASRTFAGMRSENVADHNTG